MIADEQQDQAALYVLGLLEGEELSAFEVSLEANRELRSLVAELSESAAELAFAAPSVMPPASLRAKIMEQIATARVATPVESSRTKSLNWIPWAIAAALMLFAGMLALDRSRLERELVAARQKDTLMETTLVPLAPAAPAPKEAKATVAWEPSTQSGVIRITNMPAAGAGKDYQLWVVDADHTDPIDGGILRIGSDGVAQIRFKAGMAAHRVKAFAVSLEREGGVPKKEGPIVLIGTV